MGDAASAYTIGGTTASVTRSSAERNGGSAWLANVAASEVATRFNAATAACNSAVAAWVFWSMLGSEAIAGSTVISAAAAARTSSSEGAPATRRRRADS